MSSTTFESERRAIYERMASEYRLTEIAWANQGIDFDMSKQAAWVRISIINGDALQGSIGTTKLTRYTGTIIIEVFTPSEEGVAASNEIVDEITRIFRYHHFTAEQIQCRAPNRIIVGENEGWYRVNVNIPFYRHSVD